MDMPVNSFKKALREGKPQIGLWLNLASHYSAELLAGSGFDWLLLDTEHSPNDINMVMSQLQAVAPYPTHPVVRVPWNDMVMIKRFLDVGAQTLLVPYVQNEEEAERAVAHTRYPPEGVRGVGRMLRADRFGRVKGYHKRAHEEICLLVQVETRSSIENIEKIAAVEGVDGVFIGPSDLHASYGYRGETAHPEVMPIIDEAIGRISRTGKAPGILTGVEENARHWLRLGCQFVAVGTDTGILTSESEKLVDKFKTP